VKFASLLQKCLRNTKIKKISTQKIFFGNIKNNFLKILGQKIFSFAEEFFKVKIQK
jgi:hypothetical protein